ncbi:hypothetical protein GGQ13_000316 [Salinibacter ruber]|uniref:hypothetical protein n=1 Tax=Salinibacter ruber TaxID=146919 RepID=UPI002167AC17|nr:hypothetical protein [Salinibacter ruber]MCS4136912.1 hypothetical protein [Salinibacter ruber]
MNNSDTTTDTWVSTTAATLADEWSLNKKLVRRASIAAKGVETVDGKHIEARTDGLARLHRRVTNQSA